MTEMKASLSLLVIIIISFYLPENLQSAAACEVKFERIALCFKEKQKFASRRGNSCRVDRVAPRLRQLLHRGDAADGSGSTTCCRRETDCSLIQTETELLDLIDKDEAAREDLKAEIETIKTRLFWKFAKDTGKGIFDVGSAIFSLLG